MQKGIIRQQKTTLYTRLIRAYTTLDTRFGLEYGTVVQRAVPTPPKKPNSTGTSNMKIHGASI